MKKSGTAASVMRIIFITAVMAILILPGLFINKEKDTVSVRENRVLRNFPESWTDMKDFTEQFNSWLNDNIGFRDQLLSARTAIMFNALGIVTGQSVHRGTDDWYYYTLDENLQIAMGEYTLTDDILEQILENHLAIRDKLSAKGIEYVIVMPTSKVSIYPEYLGFGDGQIRRTPVDIVADYLESHSDLRVIRLKQALIDEKNNYQVYFKHDTHWNERGAYCAYRKIISDLNKWELIDSQPVDVSFIESEHLGEFGSMLGDPMLLGVEKTEVMDISCFKAQKVTDDKYYSLENILAAHGFRQPWYYYKNDSLASAPSAMFYGDSMFGSWHITEALAENFSEFTFVWNNDIFEDSIDAVQPDIFFFEITERYLNQFPNKCRDFLFEKIQDYSADIQSFEFEGSNLNVTVLNNSSSEWSSNNLIRCCLWINNEDRWIRAYIPDGQKVSPGETITFQFENAASAVDTADTVEIQMLQEGITYFGEKEIVKARDTVGELEAEIVSHNAPVTVNHSDSYDIDITVKNTGTASWSESDLIRLCIWQDGVDYGYRITLAENETVEPGSERTFTLIGFVLPEAEATTLEFQMVKEGIMYFGEKEPAVISAVE